MSYGAGPVNATDSYQQSRGLWIETQDCSRVDIWVSQAPVLYQLKQTADQALDDPWGTEHYLPGASGQTAFYSFERRCRGVRFRNAVAGQTQAGVIVVQLIPDAELPQ